MEIEKNVPSQNIIGTNINNTDATNINNQS